MTWSKLADEDQEATINNITVLDTLTGARNGMAGHRQTTMYNTFLIIISRVIDTSISKTTFKGYISPVQFAGAVLMKKFNCSKHIVGWINESKKCFKTQGGNVSLWSQLSLHNLLWKWKPSETDGRIQLHNWIYQMFLSLSGKNIQLFFLWIKSKWQQKRGASLREEKNP